MAVIQISRIQVRRGKANNGTGIPQLASGEIAWAIDTQELFIGNGSVAEGAPLVGNTKILTERDFFTNDNMLSLVKRIYRNENPLVISTGSSVNTPVKRTIQSRLDDRVTISDFGAVADFATDNTVMLQRAIDQLFFNQSLDESYNNTSDGIKSRVILELPAGHFKITSTITIPSYATLVGAGSDRTIIEYVGTSGSAIEFREDIDQPRSIILKGMSIVTQATGYPCLKLHNIKNCAFEDLVIQGNRTNIVNVGSKGIELTGFSAILTCEQNYFNRILITGFTYGVHAKNDIMNNTFENIKLINVRTGFSLGESANGIDIGQTYGPRNTLISNCYFKNVKQHGVIIDLGSSNTIENCQFENVGNNGGSYEQIQYPQVYFDALGNIAKCISSERSRDLYQPNLAVRSVTISLANNKTISAVKNTLVQQVIVSQGQPDIVVAEGYLEQDVITANEFKLINVSVEEFNTANILKINNDLTPSNNNTAVTPDSVSQVQSTSFIPYVPEIAGHGVFESQGNLSVLLTDTAVWTEIIKLPLNVTSAGTSTGVISHTVNYVYNSAYYPFSRYGKLNIGADVRNSKVFVTDEYDFVGEDPLVTISTRLNFRAKLVDKFGTDVSITGDYDPDITYTQGQVVRFNNDLYVVTAVTVIGIEPTDTDYYTEFTGVSGPFSLLVTYSNTYAGDTGLLTYSYISSF